MLKNKIQKAQSDTVANCYSIRFMDALDLRGKANGAEYFHIGPMGTIFQFTILAENGGLLLIRLYANREAIIRSLLSLRITRERDCMNHLRGTKPYTATPIQYLLRNQHLKEISATNAVNGAMKGKSNSSHTTSKITNGETRKSAKAAAKI